MLFDDPDPTFAPSEDFEKVDRRLPKLTDLELSGVIGAVVGELVNRGNDHETAVDLVISAAEGGAEGSKLFDQMEAL